MHIRLTLVVIHLAAPVSGLEINTPPMTSTVKVCEPVDPTF